MEIKTPYRLTADVLKILLKYDKLSIEDLYSGSSEQNMVVSYKFQHFLPGYLISFYTRENNCHKKANNNVANIYIHNDNYYLSNKHLKINKKSIHPHILPSISSTPPPFYTFIYPPVIHKHPTSRPSLALQ
jgi:hypothetical protein